ncbi:MAG: LLM class flavin-dependent oxidoreductase, partial [Streptosporangiales bacterium]|nr:LLM class flavin-dependent oxidoreductase [Streptosporangiales bacterium]
MAGRVADGVIVMVGSAREFVSQALTHVAAGAAETGRDPADIDVVLWVHAALGDDAQVARDRVRGRVARMVGRRIPMTMTPSLTAEVERIRATTADPEGDYYHHQASTEADARQVPDEIVDMFALAGTPDQCGRRLREYAECRPPEIRVIYRARESRISSAVFFHTNGFGSSFHILIHSRTSFSSAT